MPNDAITPFILAVPQADLEDLNRRIDQIRWPHAETVDDWSGRPARQSQGAVRSPASPLRLAPLRGDTERLVPIQDLHRRPRHPLPARPLEARERAAAVIAHGWPDSGFSRALIGAVKVKRKEESHD